MRSMANPLLHKSTEGCGPQWAGSDDRVLKFVFELLLTDQLALKSAFLDPGIATDLE